MNYLQKNKMNLFEDTEGLNTYLTVTEALVIVDRISFIYKFLKKNLWLDLCCGKGMSALLLKFKKNNTYIGIDLIHQNCEITKNISQARVICGDVHSLPFKENMFDTITLSAAIYYLDRNRLIPEIYRVLKKNGILIFDTSNSTLPGFNFARESKDYFSAKDWIEFISSKGFYVNCYEGSQKFQGNKTHILIQVLKNILKKFFFKIEFFRNKLRNVSIKYKDKIYFDKNYLYKHLDLKKEWSKIDQNNLSKSLVLYFVCKKV